MKNYQVIVAALAFFAACAVVKPPTGGEEDTIPPSVEGIRPAPESEGVARDADITFSFSEKVDETSFKNRITTYPPIDFRKIEVKGKDVIVSFKEELPETTICVLLKSGFKDDHLVVSRENHIYYFSTRDRLDSGVISGKIFFKHRPDSNGVAFLVQVRGDTIGELFREKESRVVFADRFGNYSFKALPTDSSRFLLWSFIDKDSDGRYSEGKEFAAVYPDTIILADSFPMKTGADMNVIDPDEPGTLSGVLRNLTGISRLPAIRLDRMEEKEAFIFAETDSLGDFIIRGIKPGSYLWTAFLDIKADSLPGEYTDPDDSTKVFEEPGYSPPDTLRIGPGEDKILPPVEITKAR
ncbi:MAG: Ig-like domain-containing protein [Candidatus Krumholzibacteriota bacterium]|nr:Ig-like domain-containing protein [Candidatus Krumholzibacteriota bacterium]